MITLKKITKFTHQVYYKNILLGTFDLDVDGHYFTPDKGNRGGYTEYSLKLVLDALTEINAPFNAEVEEYFKKEGFAEKKNKNRK